MFGLGHWELLLILLVILLVFGAKRIPEMAQGMGRGIREFRKAVHEVQDEVEAAKPDLGKPDLGKPDLGKPDLGKTISPTAAPDQVARQSSEPATQVAPSQVASAPAAEEGAAAKESPQG